MEVIDEMIDTKVLRGQEKKLAEAPAKILISATDQLPILAQLEMAKSILEDIRLRHDNGEDAEAEMAFMLVLRVTRTLEKHPEAARLRPQLS